MPQNQARSTCNGFPGVIDRTADKLQNQYWVLGTVDWEHNRYHLKKHLGGWIASNNYYNWVAPCIEFATWQDCG